MSNIESENRDKNKNNNISIVAGNPKKLLESYFDQ